MVGPRQSGMLPTIKCSTCGNQVEISMMGEHVCSGVGPATDRELKSSSESWL